MTLCFRIATASVAVLSVAHRAPAIDALPVVSLRVFVSQVGATPVSPGVAVRVVARRMVGILSDHPEEPVISATATREVTLALTPGLWELTAHASGFWGQPEGVFISPGLEIPRHDVVLHIWQAGLLEGSVNFPLGTIPDDFEVVFPRPAEEPGQGPQVGPSIWARCPIQGDNWRCELPAATLDLQLRARYAVPHYLWGVAVPPGRTRNLGALVMQRGSSISGWVRMRDGSASRNCTVVLASVEGTGAPSEPLRSFSSVTNSRGFFQIAGPPPGNYQVVASSGQGAEASAPVMIMKDAESALTSPLILSLPATLDLHFRPQLGPEGKPWTVTVLKGDENPLPIVRGATVLQDGTWRRQGLAPGPYRIVVEAGRGSRWHTSRIDLAEGAAEVLTLAIPVSDVRGTVRLGDHPLEARLVFGGRSGPLRVTLTSDTEGRFSGRLPADPSAASSWTLFVQSQDQSVTRVLEHVKVVPGDELNILLPSTRLEGVLVDEEGKPVPRAVVTAEPGGGGTAQQKVNQDAKGEFRFDGLEPGRYVVSAETEEAASSSTAVDLDEAQKAPPVRLVLRRHAKLRLVVTSPEGDPVPAARVKALPMQLLQSSASLSLTERDGGVDLLMPPDTTEVGLSIGAPGFAYWFGRVAIPPNGVSTLRLARQGGTLRLETPAAATSDGSASRAYLLHAGFVDSPAYLERWARLHGSERQRNDGAWSIPQMQAGTYTLCLGTLLEFEGLVRTGGKTASRCVSATLQPGRDLHLKTP